MKNIRVFLSEFFFIFLEVKVSIYLNRRVFVTRSRFASQAYFTQISKTRELTSPPGLMMLMS